MEHFYPNRKFCWSAVSLNNNKNGDREIQCLFDCHMDCILLTIEITFDFILKDIMKYVCQRNKNKICILLHECREKKKAVWRIITPNKSRKRRKIMGEMVYMLKLDSATENIHAHQHTLHILIYIRKVFILCSC